jgi:protein TonB
MSTTAIAHPPRYADGSYGPIVVASVALHVVVLVVIPLLTVLLSKTVTYQRPQTFQLVQPAMPQAAVRQVRQKTSAPKPTAAEPKPAEKRAAPSDEPKEQEQQDEDVDDLENLLNALPATSLSAAGDFKFSWYTNLVSQRIQDNWRPPTDRKDVSTGVSFTIFSDGSISEPRISQSSGDAMLDNLAIKAVQLAAPFPKIPPGYDKELSMNVTLRPTRG